MKSKEFGMNSLIEITGKKITKKGRFWRTFICLKKNSNLSFDDLDLPQEFLGPLT